MKKNAFLATTILGVAGLCAPLASAQSATVAGAGAGPDVAEPQQAATQSGESASGVAVDRVVVTAQKRAEDVQDVPISITAFSSDMLEESGVTDIRDLSRITPGLYMATAPQKVNTRVAIRGIGTSGNTAIEPSVAFFLNGVYTPRVGSLLSGLNDIDTIEVLRGPQGTLFGRNASSGAVSVRTARPTNTYGGEAGVGVGGFGGRSAFGVFNAPITDTWGLRLSALGEASNGYGINDLTGKSIGRSDTVSVRLTSDFDIAPNLNWLVSGDYQHSTGDGMAVVTVVAETVTPQTVANWRERLDPDGAGPLQGLVPYTDDTYSRRVFQESDGDLSDYQTGVSSELAWSLDGGYELKLISGYRDWHNEQYQGSSGNVPLLLQARTGTFDSQSHSQELQLLSPDTLLGGRANFVTGLYYYTEDFDISESFSFHPTFCGVFIRNTQPARVAACQAGQQENASQLNFAQSTKSYAVYGQGTYRLTDDWDVTLGARYSSDEKEAVFQQQIANPLAARAVELTSLELDESKPTYRIATTYRPTNDMMLFASWSTGFKSGGFDSGGGATVGGQGRKFAAETVENIEGGVRSEWFAGRLTANATLFRMDVSNYQFRTYDGISFRVQNNGEIRQQGVEFDVTARPVAPITLNLAATYLDSEYLDFRGAPALPAFSGTQDLTGERVPFSPRWQGVASAAYDDQLPWNDMSWQIRGDINFISEQILSSAGDNNPESTEPGYAQFGMRLALRGSDDAWELALLGQNLTDERSCGTRFAQPNHVAFRLQNTVTGGTALRCTLSSPRSYSLRLKTRF